MKNFANSHDIPSHQCTRRVNSSSVFCCRWIGKKTPLEQDKRKIAKVWLSKLGIDGPALQWKEQDPGSQRMMIRK
jgi:hypothetical protein